MTTLITIPETPLDRKALNLAICFVTSLLSVTASRTLQSYLGAVYAPTWGISGKYPQIFVLVKEKTI
jgi:hypothetical protein